MKILTKAEEQVMLLLWEKQKATAREIMDLVPEPKPAYTTISTIIRILETKGFVSHEEFGKTHIYFPVVKQEDYADKFVGNFVKDYFDNSYRRLVSSFTKRENLSIADLEEIRKIVDSEILKKKE